MLLSFALWLCFPLSTYFLARGFNLELSFPGALLVQLFLTAAVVPPQAPGFIGLFQVAAITGAELCGVPTAEAGAFATMLWAVNVLPITAVGLGLLWHQGLSLRRLAEGSGKAAAEWNPAVEGCGDRRCEPRE